MALPEPAGTGAMTTTPAWELVATATTGRWDLHGLRSRSNLSAVDVAETVKNQPYEVRLTGWHPIERNANGAALITILRELQSVGRRLRWSGILDGVPLLKVVHLAPPDHASGVESDWARRHRYGLFYYRRGPEFVSVVDRRDADNPNRYVIYDPDLLEVFASGLSPQSPPRTRLSEPAVKMLIDESIVSFIGETLVTLPCRMRDWPIPYDAV